MLNFGQYIYECILKYFLIINSFSSGGQTVLREGGNEGEAGNQLERKNINSEQVSKQGLSQNNFKSTRSVKCVLICNTREKILEGV